jgi:hypothetical protein
VNTTLSRPIFWPLVLVAIGVLWLLSNFNLIDPNNIGILFRLWPVLLIGLGLDVLVRQRWPMAGNLIALVIVTLGVLAVLFAPQLGYTHAINGWFYPALLVWGRQSGSGTVITETRPASDFDAVSFNSFGELVIRQGEAEELSIEAEDNVLREIHTLVRNGTLYIEFNESNGWALVQPTQPVRFLLTVKRLNHLDLNGLGNVIVKALSTEELQTTLQGTGNLSLENVNITSFDLHLSGAGSVDASGTAQQLDTQVSGLGSYRGGSLQSEKANVRISGVGSAIVWVTQQLEAHISGLGSVQYYGDPTVSQTVSGLGGVQRLGDK